MADLAVIAPRLAAVLPRLTSDHDGEALAAARAVGRVLASAGADIFDLVAAFERGARALPPPQKPQARTDAYMPPRWRSLTPGQRDVWINTVLDEAAVSPWEASFLSSIRERHRRAPLSEKQMVILDRLLAETWDLTI